MKKRRSCWSLSAILKSQALFIFQANVLQKKQRIICEVKGLKRVAAYHGGMEQEQRILIQQQFLFGQLNIICATSAFGMGINKDNIRFVIHYHLPNQIESYLQEIGRAGRDGAAKYSIIALQCW